MLDSVIPRGREPAPAEFARVPACAAISRRQHVHDTLRQAIIAGRFPPEHRLNERNLAAELGVSTTPLKEALRGLEGEGLVRIEARRGVFVTFSAVQAEEMALARAALESMIARLAARRARAAELEHMRAVAEGMEDATHRGAVEELIQLNERFHNAIHAASGCGYLQRLLLGQHTYDHATRVALLSQAGESASALVEHRRILEALTRRDADGAERAMRDHIVRSGEQHVRMLFHPATTATPQQP